MRKGLFITFEGGEGLGKTTQSRLLVERLKDVTSAPVLRTEEPGGTALGQQLREILKHSKNPVCTHAEALLLAAARSQHVDELIRPAVEEGQIVICDRYHDSTAAYQGAGHGMSQADLRHIHHIATGNYLPHLTFVFVGKAHRDRGDDRFERLDDAFHERVRRYFKGLTGTATRYSRIDANRTEQEISDEILGHIRRYMSMSSAF